MSDLPPSADTTPAPAPEPAATARPAGRSDVAAILAQLPEDQARALAPSLGVDLDQVTVRATEAAAPNPFPDMPDGGADGLSFPDAGNAPRKVLTIGDQLYRCRGTVPGGVLRDAMEASSTLASQASDGGEADVIAANTGLLDLMLRLTEAAMLPSDFARFHGRYTGDDLGRYVCTRDPDTGVVTIEPPVDPEDEVDAIGLMEVSMYGSRLVQAYTARPTDGRAPSGA